MHSNKAKELAEHIFDVIDPIELAHMMVGIRESYFKSEEFKELNSNAQWTRTVVLEMMHSLVLVT